MPTPETLRKRLALLHRWEDILARLEAGDEDQSGMRDAIEVLDGIMLNAQTETMAMVFKGLVQTINNMQPIIDDQQAKF